MKIKISYNSNIYVLLRHSFFIVKNVEVTYKATKIVSAFQKVLGILQVSCCTMITTG
jgi:hypothetical protein